MKRKANKYRNSQNSQKDYKKTEELALDNLIAAISALFARGLNREAIQRRIERELGPVEGLPSLIAEVCDQFTCEIEKDTVARWVRAIANHYQLLDVVLDSPPEEIPTRDKISLALKVEEALADLEGTRHVPGILAARKDFASVDLGTINVKIAIPQEADEKLKAKLKEMARVRESPVNLAVVEGDSGPSEDLTAQADSYSYSVIGKLREEDKKK